MESRHIADVAEIEKECFSVPWSRNALSAELQKENSFFFVCEDDEGKACGYAGMNTVLDEGYITNVAVLKEYRRNGIADSLLKTLNVVMTEKKLSFITLEVRKSNVPAISLYKKHGYIIVGERKKFYRLPDEDAYIMTKE